MSVEILRHVVLLDIFVEGTRQDREKPYACMRSLDLQSALCAILRELCQNLEQIAFHDVGMGKTSLHVEPLQLVVVVSVPSYQIVQDRSRLVTNCYTRSASLQTIYSAMRLQ